MSLVTLWTLTAHAQKRQRIDSAVAVGDSIPSTELHLGFPPEKINITERFAGKNVILLGLPGAFTPT